MSDATLPIERLVGHLTAIVERLERIERALTADKPAELLTIAEAAERFKLSKQFLYAQRSALVKFGRAVRVDVAKLQSLLEKEE